MKKLIPLTLTISLIITACQVLPILQNNTCGDGNCDAPETCANCSLDCDGCEPLEIPGLEETLAAEVTPEQPSATAEQPVVLIGFMVHLEGWDDARKEDAFIRHAAVVREYADLFEQYGAKITFESKEFTDGCAKWGDNVLLEMQQRGHGVGVHADEGGTREADECGDFTFNLVQKREALEALGIDVMHVSGVVSKCDWVTASAQAGFDFVSGTVAYAAMSLAPELRPAEYANCPNPAQCHQVFPTELEDRLHPWRAEDGSNWILPDPDGQLVILSASQGLTCMQEELASGKTGECVFNQADINTYIEQLELAISMADPSQVNIFYVGNSMGAPLDMDVLEAWLQAIQPYVESGQVQWATLQEMYQAYIEWEQ